MKRTILLPFLLATLPLFAQEKSAAKHDGMFIPMVTDAEMFSLDRPGQGAMVYNKTDHAFWFFDGEWRPLLSAEFSGTGEGIHWRQQRTAGHEHGGQGAPKLSSGTSGFWDLTGNATTDETINFIGTTDAHDLRFRVNNQLAGTLSTTSQNVTFGPGAGLDLDPGSMGNTFIGYDAGSQTTAAFLNTCVGYHAGTSNTTGNSNVLIGNNAQNSSGSSNVVIGNNSGGGITGSDNVFVGAGSGGDNVGGFRNTFLGGFAGNTTTEGDRNTFVGFFAGEDFGSNVNITGTDNTALGYRTNFASTSLINAAAIGASAQVGASNCMVLGSVAGVNGATASVNVGIGTTAPQDRLHVVGSLRMQDGNQAAGRVLVCDANGKGTWTATSTFAPPAWGLNGSAGTNPSTNFLGTSDAQSLALRTNNTERLRVESTGDVGIGTTNPQQLLHLFKGNSSAAINSNALLVVEDDANAYINVVTPDANEGGLLFGTPSSSAEGAITYNQTATPNGLSFRTNGNISRAVIDQNGFLGIGNTAPLTRVDITGGLAVRRPGTVVLGAGANTVTVGDNSYLRIQGAATATVNLSNGLGIGQFLYIEGLTTSFTINDNAGVSNCNLGANRIIGDDDTLSLIWNGTDWVELAFANN